MCLRQQAGSEDSLLLVVEKLAVTINKHHLQPSTVYLFGIISLRLTREGIDNSLYISDRRGTDERQKIKQENSQHLLKREVKGLQRGKDAN